ncbi:hypothetical protein [Alteromonas phage JH01]|nr:hypothetical protein [Alteromonas phage JH01]
MHTTPLELVTSLENKTGFDVSLVVNTKGYTFYFETRTATGTHVSCKLELLEREWRDAPMRVDYYAQIAKREMCNALDSHIQQLQVRSKSANTLKWVLGADDE